MAIWLAVKAGLATLPEGVSWRPVCSEIALDVMQAKPAASLFVDDREEDVAGARPVGLRALHAPDPGRLVEYLRDAGIKT